MSDNRTAVVNNAKDLFNRALAAGLDFRMGVTGVVDFNNASKKPYHGKFCSKISTVNSDDGGVDRFLLPTELNIFEACVKNPRATKGDRSTPRATPPRRWRVTCRGPPRSEQDPLRRQAGDHLRDRRDQSADPAAIVSVGQTQTCSLDPVRQAQVHQFVAPDVNFFLGKTNPQATATVHMIGGVCGNGCNAQVGHGMIEIVQATNGTTGDVCQADLGKTLQIIIDDIVGAASAASLEFLPISRSLKVSLDGVVLGRSRTVALTTAAPPTHWRSSTCPSGTARWSSSPTCAGRTARAPPDGEWSGDDLIWLGGGATAWALALWGRF